MIKIMVNIEFLVHFFVPSVFNDIFTVTSPDAVSSSLQLLSTTDNTLTSRQDAPNNLTHTLIGPRIQPLANNRVVQTFNSQPSANLIQSKYNTFEKLNYV